MEKMKLEEKDEYIDFLLKQYRLVDALWFLAVEDEFGIDAAVKLDERVWEKMGSRSAKEIKERFGIQERGLRGLMRALEYFPWRIIAGYEIIQQDDRRALLRVPRCPPQLSRIKAGRGEFPCKQMHFMAFKSFAAQIDERIEIRCIFAPPDQHPEDCFCMWEFVLK